ncbi:MAG: cupredoxin domain-containing protein [Gemmatimonadales bacterium]|jgi:plastocyanin
MRPSRPFVALVVAACSACAPGGGAAYVPRARDVTLTAVPLLTKEMGRIYPFLSRDFAPGGVLAGREVYAFVPSTVTVVEGDTVRFRFVNPEDDAHTFVLGDLAVGLPGQSTTHATWIARRAGIHTFLCDIPAHQPSMWGQVIVLAPGAVRNGAAAPLGAGGGSRP